MTKLTKTEATIVTRCQKNGTVAILTGCDRGQSGTEKLRSFGRNEDKAARSLASRGILITVTRVVANDHEAPGFMSPSTETVYKLSPTIKVTRVAK